ncbi:hypothetical protein ACIRQY_20735 [Streptomyces sp. NPDC101490]|uniref:hypothetical protein n=1 Tax=Streptomyces sp. NPDC101490 TaxID=3366143 RepID=UPI00381E0091
MKGGQALVAELNRIVYSSGISSPVTSKRGLSARLRYLDSKKGREALREQGVSPRTIRSWMAGKSKAAPTARNLAKIDSAYWTRRRENVARSGWLGRHLDNNGQGRRMEIHPVNDTAVPTEYRRREISQRTITLRYVGEDLANAWAARDENSVDEIWDDVLTELDSDYEAYAYVSHIGINA